MKKANPNLALIGAVMTAQAFKVKSAQIFVWKKYKSKMISFHLELGGNFMNFAELQNPTLTKWYWRQLAKSIGELNFFTLPDYSDQSQSGNIKALQKALQKERYELLMETSEAKKCIVVYSKRRC